MQLNCNVKAEDYEKCQTYISANQTATNPLITMVNSILFGGMAFALLKYFQRQHVEFSIYLLMLSAVLLIASVVMLTAWRKRGGFRVWWQQLSGDYVWEINAAGITLSIVTAQTKEPSSTFIAWPQVRAVTEGEDAWYIYVRKNGAFSIPKRAQNSGGTHDFIVHVSQYWSAHPDNYGLRLQTQPPTAQKPFWVDLFHNLTLGIKNAFFMTAHPLNYRVRNSQLLALFVVEAFGIAAFEYYSFFPDAVFNMYGVSQHIVASALFILAGLAVAYKLNSQAWFLRLTLILQASLFVPTLVYLLGLQVLPESYRDNAHWELWWVYIAWMLAIAYQSIRKLYQLPHPLTVYFLAVFTFIALVMPRLFGQQQFFNEDYNKTAEKYQQNIDQEAVYYQQATLVDNAIQALAPQRAGVTDMYYVGFAGYGYQKVFANEVKFAQQLFDKQFDTKNRSANLITHESTLNTIPLANTYNLTSILNGVAKKMDVNEDILFLFLSSHGSKTFDLSVSLYPFEMKNLAADKVKKILDESGIKNRVIVVSACYSGGFVDVLKDENTLILTAARKDRSSFGCSEEAQHTYFGDAFFVQALQKEKSFTKAFEQAKIIIATREKTEQKTEKPSLPQMYEGVAIKPKLDAWLNTLP